MTFKIKEYDQSKATKNSKMLSLDQIIEFYDEHQTSNGNGKFILDNEKITENLKRIEAKKTAMERKNRSNKLKFGKKIYEFYNAPITKFWQNTLIYILFLVCFSYIVLVKTPSKPSIFEIFFLVYVFSYGLDKFRELLQTDSPRFSGKIKIFFAKIINSLDVISILTIIVALGFRLSSYQENHKVARLIYCVNTIFWYVKLLEFLIINKYTGPLIIIASRMVSLIN